MKITGSVKVGDGMYAKLCQGMRMEQFLAALGVSKETHGWVRSDDAPEFILCSLEDIHLTELKAEQRRRVILVRGWKLGLTYETYMTDFDGKSFEDVEAALTKLEEEKKNGQV